MNDNRLIIQKEHNRVMALARNKFPLSGMLYDPAVKFYTSGKSAGKAYGYSKVSYNIHVFAQDMETFMRDVIPHEIAHVVCSFLGWDKGHGNNWKRVCRVLGGNGQRTYSPEGIEFSGTRTRKKYEYKATCGTIVLLSDVRHGKMKRGMSYSLTNTGGKVSYMNFTGKVV